MLMFSIGGRNAEIPHLMPGPNASGSSVMAWLPMNAHGRSLVCQFGAASNQGQPMLSKQSFTRLA
jgi:hypothetical protein